MLRRLISLALLIAAIGFIGFAVTLPRPADDSHADGVVVLTGGDGRIARGLATLRSKEAPRMLVAGVDPEVKVREFAAHYHVEPRLLQCCVTLGYESVDTRSNAQEATRWILANHLHSVRLVTSDWHMRRAAWELQRALPAGVTLIEDAVPTRPTLNTLFLEYCKYAARRASRLWHQ